VQSRRRVVPLGKCQSASVADSEPVPYLISILQVVVDRRVIDERPTNKLFSVSHTEQKGPAWCTYTCVQIDIQPGSRVLDDQLRDGKALQAHCRLENIVDFGVFRLVLFVNRIKPGQLLVQEKA